MSLQNKVKVRVHIAYFQTKPGVPYFFINIWNKCKRQHITVVKVEFLEEMTHDGIGNSTYLGVGVSGCGNKILPVTIPPQTEWETYMKAKDTGEDVGSNDVLVTLTDGRRLTSKRRKNVAPSGRVLNG